MDLKKSLQNLKDKRFRLNKLYSVINKNGENTPFIMNAVQEDVFDGLHNRNLILKARQLGMSTFSVLYLLDECIWNPNLSAGIVSYSLEHAQFIFKRIIGHALDNLPPWFLVKVKSRSAREIVFENGSVLRVDTTLRGGAYQLVLVSEFGKTCARNPLKAEEIVTGTLQAVPLDGRIIIESTAEGNEGYFSDMVTEALRNENEALSTMDYKLFFYGWYTDPNYTLNDKVSIEVEDTDYLAEVESKCQITLTQGQKNWYVLQKRILKDKMKQEFPSTPQEAFLTSSEAYYFSKPIEEAYSQGRCLYTNIHDPLQQVYIAMDIGINDLTVIIFFQVIHGEIRIIDYMEGKDVGLDHYARHLLYEKRFSYNTIFLPHDAKQRSKLDETASYEREFRKLFSHTDTRFIVLKRLDKQLQISYAKNKFGRCVFNVSKTKKLIDHLAKYRKKWNEKLGKYSEEPLENICSHYADAFMYVTQAVGHIEAAGNTKGSLEKHRQLVESRSKILM